VTPAPTPNRRDLLRGLVAVAALPLAAACTPGPSLPDPLEELARAAESDAAVARAAVARFPALAAQAGAVATNRAEQAAALRREIDRTATQTAPSTTAAPSSAPPVPDDQATVLTTLVAALDAAQKRAAEVALTVPSYRAGLVGSVAAGCASLKEVLS